MKKVLTMAITFATIASLAISASASNFVSSVVQSEAPTVESVTLTDADGNAVEADFDLGDIIVTPVSESDTLDDIDEDAREALEAAYEEIEAAEDLAEYFGLDELTDEDEYYVVSALFDVTFTGTAEEAVNDVLAAGGSITLTFQAEINNPDSVSVLVQCDGENWTNSEVNSATTSSVTATFTEFCPVAIVEVASTTTSESSTGTGTSSGSDSSDSSDDSVTSPKTSDGVPVYAIGAVTFVVLAGACFVASKKRA